MPECGVTAQEDEEEEDDEASESFSPPQTADSRRRMSFSPTSRSRSLSSVQRADVHGSQKSAGSQPNSDSAKTAQRSGSNMSDETTSEQQRSRSRSLGRVGTMPPTVTILQKSVNSTIICPYFTL